MNEDLEPNTELDGETRDRNDQRTLARAEAALRSPAGTSRLGTGQTFGEYRLLSLLGKGGFGQVWEAESLATGRRLALKVLTEKAGLGESARRRFEREGRLAASVSHPRCVYVFGAEEIEGCPAISMELVAGGTLQDEVKRRGALPYKEAVDRILDVLEGLEAAHAKGVIHRDVKPSNCFLDASGHAKIGDFGLSRTLEVDTKLTTTGVFMGTPAYSSPEQVRAETLDFRSDMYGAGASLYTLLAGDVPYPGSQLGPVLARILADPPAPLNRVGTTVPLGLERVVQRLMAKERDKRYPSYTAARAALALYSSQGLTAASLARRIAAIMIDAVLLMPVRLLLAPWRYGQLVVEIACGAYFWLLEGRWGASVGKRVLHLRVVAAGGGEAGWGAIALRSAIYALVSTLHVWPRMLLSDSAAARYARTPWPLAITFASVALLVAPMRRRNLLAGMHEVVSGTRVVALSERAAAALPPGKTVTALSGEGGALGPFVIEGVLWQHAGDSLALARDPILERSVFVHRFGRGQAARPIAFLAHSAPGRLHWLQGSRSEAGGAGGEDGQAWDVFEAPDGLSLVDWVKVRGRLAWSDVASVLSPLIPELQQRQSAGLPLSLDQVWVDTSGHGRLLDFPLRDPSSADAAEVFPPEEWQSFLGQFLLFSLEGRLVPRAQLAGQSARVPLCEGARIVVDAVCSDVRLASPAELSARLAAIADQPAEVNLARRGAALAIAGIAPAFACFTGLILALWAGPLVDIISLQAGLKRHAAASQTTPAADARRDAVERLIAHYGLRVKARAEAEAAGAVSTANPMFQATSARQFLAELEPGQRQQLDTFVVRGALTPEELVPVHEAAKLSLVTPAIMAAITFTIMSVPAAILGLLLAGLSRGGVGLRLGGILVQKADGSRPSRWRCLGRGVLAWFPFLPPAAVFLAGHNTWMPPACIATLLVVGAGAVYALARPSCGVQDLLSGTHLVPR